VVRTTVVVRQVTNGPEATRILDALDAAVDLPSDRLTNGRRYTLSSRTQVDRKSAVVTLTAELDRISSAWSEHLTIAGLD
jgi:hypothetical protein